MPIANNRIIRALVKDRYSAEEVRSLFATLTRNGTFVFPALPNGLFPAANLQPAAHDAGYGNVWVRDNIYIAMAHYVNGKKDVAITNVRALAEYFYKHRSRFERIIEGEADSSEPMHRPHIRFRGEDLTELREKWAHAQNDALGYFVWLFCLLCVQEHLVPSPQEKRLLTLFALYWKRIEYWKDEDSGHWEERRKIEASSIGVVVRALGEFKRLLELGGTEGFTHDRTTLAVGLLDKLMARGSESLHMILPAECIQKDPGKARPCDAALVFLIFPMGVVEEDVADKILENVIRNLQGGHGIRRYVGDSFWAPDYKKRVKAEERAIDVSDDMAARDSLLNPREEAQWCIFDPILSIIFGLKYQRYRREADLLRQIRYFNRSLCQLTEEGSPYGGYMCPELYYVEDGAYTVNDTVPLLWTQANLWMAFKYLNDSLREDSGTAPAGLGLGGS